MRPADRPALEALPVQPLLLERPASGSSRRLPPALVADLRGIAEATDSLSDRAARLWNLLRKHLGQPLVPEVLEAIAALARAGDPAGARLLAALLEVRAPGAEMVARIHRFDSCRRLRARAAAVDGGWRRRFDEVEATCRARAAELPGPTPAGARARDAAPFPLLRRWLEHLLATLAREGDLGEDDTRLLVALARLEVDAYEERVSRAAGAVNPYLASAVSRVLPLLSQADGEIRAMRDFIAGLEASRAGVAFRRRMPRMDELLSPGEREQLLRGLEGRAEVAEVHMLLRGLGRAPIPMRRLAGAAARIMALGARLRAQGVRRTDLDLLSAVAIVQQGERDGETRVPLGEDLAGAVVLALGEATALHGAPAAGRAEEDGGGAPEAPALTGQPPREALPLGDAAAAAALLSEARGEGAAPAAGGGTVGWPLDGFRFERSDLVLRVPQEGRADRPWRDDLPAAAALAEAGAAVEALDTAALKRLVLANLDNVSVTLGFLRNAKVTSIPGLVATVVARARSARILEIIANDRALYTGFANKDVPRALLTSPCNIPVKSLAKFVHVKYVNKLDLQRMAKDRTGIRREVLKEIQAYLDTLGTGG